MKTSPEWMVSFLVLATADCLLIENQNKHFLSNSISVH